MQLYMLAVEVYTRKHSDSPKKTLTVPKDQTLATPRNSMVTGHDSLKVSKTENVTKCRDGGYQPLFCSAEKQYWNSNLS